MSVAGHNRVRRLGTVALAAGLLALFAPPARAADLVWTNPAGGYWTNYLNWNGSTYPGEVASDSAYLTNDLAGTYRVILNTTPPYPVPSVVVSNDTAETWLLVTNGSYAGYASFVLKKGARLAVETGSTMWSMAGNGVNLLGPDPAIYLNGGAGLYSVAAGPYYYLVPIDSSGTTGLVTSTTSEPGFWDISGPYSFVGWRNIGAASDNQFIVDRVTMYTHFYLGEGYGACRNGFVITNGARIHGGGSGSFCIGDGTAANGNYCIVTGTNSLLELGGRWFYFAGTGYATGNWMRVENGATVTNGSTHNIPYSHYSDQNGIIITNGGRYFVGDAGAANIALASSYIGQSNFIVVAGAGSLYDLKGQGNLTIGRSDNASKANLLRVSEGGTVARLNTLTVYTNNSVELFGGTVSVAMVTYQGPLFTVGDGVQSAALDAAGGTLNFYNGVFITNNATMSGYGWIVGGPVTVTNGGTIAPSIGSGALHTTNLTWYGGGLYRCRVSDVNSSPGMGWSVLNVSTQLELVAAGSTFTVRLDSAGVNVANFYSNRNYNLRVVSYGTLTGYDPAQFFLDTNAMLLPEPALTPWTLTNLNSNLYVIYRPSNEVYSAGYVWNTNNSGDWSDTANWLGGVVPPSDANGIIEFPGGATPYVARTNETGTPFDLNKLLLSASTRSTNVITGNALRFNGDDGGIYKTGDGGSYILSNSLMLAGDVLFRGLGIGGTLTIASNLTGTGAIRKEGTWDLILGQSNDFSGLIVLDSQDGVLEASSPFGLGTNSVVVSNGTLRTSLTHFNNSVFRSVALCGTGSLWTNAASLTLGTNAAVIVSGGRLSCNGPLLIAGLGTVPVSLTLTNAGRVSTRGATACVGTNSYLDRVLVIGTNSSWDAGAQDLTVGGGIGSSNVLSILDAGVVTNVGYLSVGSGSGAQRNVLTNAGGYVLCNRLYVGGTAGAWGNEVYVADGGIIDCVNNSCWIGAGGSNNGIRIVGSNSMLRIRWGGSGGGIILGGDGTTGTVGNWLRLEDGAQVTGSDKPYFLLGYGNDARDNQIVITNAGKYTIFNHAYLGYGSRAASNALVVSGAGSWLECNALRLYLTSGNDGTGNWIRVDNGGDIRHVGNLYLGCGNGHSRNRHHCLTIIDGGKVSSGYNGGGLYLAGDNTGMSNRVEVVGSNSEWNHVGVLTIGSGRNSSYSGNTSNWIKVDGGLLSGATSLLLGSGSWDVDNGVIVTNGGRMYTSAASVIGNKATANSNWVVVTGSGSLWDLGAGDLSVGVNANATGNYFRVDHGGTVDDLGTLRVSSNNLVNLWGGTLALRSAAVTNGLPFVVGDGTQYAALKAVAGSALSCSFHDGLIVTNSATLSGCGSIAANTMVYGTLDPGAPGVGGALTNIGDLRLAGGAETRIEIADYTSAGLGWDLLVVEGGTLSLDGNLKVVTARGGMPEAGQTFLIITNTDPAGITGAFTNASNLAYVYTNELSDPIGTMEVVINPQAVLLGGYSPAMGPAYIDDIAIGTNMPMCIDNDQDGMSDLWEIQTFGSTTASDGTHSWDDADGDGVPDAHEYLAGTDPTNSASYMRISALDLSTPTGSDLTLNWLAGNYSGVSVYSNAGDRIGRSFTVYAANNNATNVKTVAVSQPDALLASGLNTWTDTNVVNLYAHRFYAVGTTHGGVSYTNTAEEWAMHVQGRTTNQSYLICVPVDFGSTNANTLGSTLGAQLGRGLYSNNQESLADTIRYMSATGWSAVYLSADGWSTGSVAFDLYVPPGMALWVARGTNTPNTRTNAVFAGKSYTEATVTNYTLFTTNENGGWTAFGWPLARQRWHSRAAALAGVSNQLGFEAIGTGGTSANPAKTNLLGDQIWLWGNNHWTNYYWLIYGTNEVYTNYNFRWWDPHANAFADFALEPGMAYYYRHTTNNGATNFYWKPSYP